MFISVYHYTAVTAVLLQHQQLCGWDLFAETTYYHVLQQNPVLTHLLKTMQALGLVFTSIMF